MVSYIFVLVVLATIYQGVSLLPFDIEQVQLKTNYPSSPNKNEAQLDAFYYLMKYGYVNGDNVHQNSKSGKLLTTDSIKEAIKKFQVTLTLGSVAKAKIEYLDNYCHCLNFI